MDLDNRDDEKLDDGWFLDYEHYDIEQFEGPERRLYLEDFHPSPVKEKPRNPLFSKLTTKGLYPALVFIAVAYMVSVYDWKTSGTLGISGRAFFEYGEYWRSVTALFVHADLAHLLSNSWLLMIFGWLLFQVGGTTAFPWLSLLIGAITNVITVYVYPPQVNLVGASGMVYGMVGLWLTWFVRFDTTPVAFRWLRVIAFTLMVMFPTTFREEVSYLAHGAGFGVGVVFGLLFRAKGTTRTDASLPGSVSHPQYRGEG